MGTRKWRQLLPSTGLWWGPMGQRRQSAGTVPGTTVCVGTPCPPPRLGLVEWGEVQGAKKGGLDGRAATSCPLSCASSQSSSSFASIDAAGREKEVIFFTVQMKMLGSERPDVCLRPHSLSKADSVLDRIPSLTCTSRVCLHADVSPRCVRECAAPRPQTACRDRPWAQPLCEWPPPGTGIRPHSPLSPKRQCTVDARLTFWLARNSVQSPL